MDETLVATTVMETAVANTRSRAEEEDEPSCRICYCVENPVGCLKDLISPCGCKGTVKYVHRYCLRIWRFKGKMIKDIKVCEQCFCEYQVDDERKTSVGLVSLSTVAVLLSIVLATNIFLVSTADTITFIGNDVNHLFFGRKMAEGSFGSRPILLSRMEEVPARRKGASSGYRLIKLNLGRKKRSHLVCDKKVGLYTLKNAHLLNVLQNGVFSSITAVSLLYALLVENTWMLLLNLGLALWRILAFGTLADWVVYTGATAYVYLRIYRRLYAHIDSYCMYVVNFY
ncbi:hypothetical protein NEHOM01_0738 [Nematocida homosporus]|uniref:uncharacterized protein n=1 Tax=Nematocida homosporus TaxID=1912981 RepID=UPI00221E7D49|nr:uncharacterized protein NEHOM01_0738 [Nematocida homosporus]KAI5185280.1 hypothetical protein NEHOM01_0738 [Nematocida homosporus]